MKRKKKDSLPPKGICAHKNCNETAYYKAPLSPTNIKKYQYFCLEHIKSFNANWNFYKNWDEKQIEQDRHGIPYWHRPSWPMSDQEGRLRSKINDFLSLDDALSEPILKNKKDELPLALLSNEEIEAFKRLDLKPVKDKKIIKERYKKLAQKFHPDQNPGNKEALEMMKKINTSYRIINLLLQKLAL